MMAGYRQFHTMFWKDEYIIELEPLEKLLYAYLFTNELSSISGLYKIPFRVIVNETCLDKDFTKTTLAKFEADKKIMYRDGVMWVVKMHKYHSNASPQTMKKVNSDVDDIDNCACKYAYQYYAENGIYPTDTVLIQYADQVLKDKDKDKDKSNLNQNQISGSDDDDHLPRDPVIVAFDNAWPGSLSSANLLMLDKAVEMYTAEWVIDAITEAVKHNAKSFAYADKILQTRKANGGRVTPKPKTRILTDPYGNPVEVEA